MHKPKDELLKSETYGFGFRLKFYFSCHAFSSSITSLVSILKTPMLKFLFNYPAAAIFCGKPTEILEQ